MLNVAVARVCIHVKDQETKQSTLPSGTALLSSADHVHIAFHERHTFLLLYDLCIFSFWQVQLCSSLPSAHALVKMLHGMIAVTGIYA